MHQTYDNTQRRLFNLKETCGFADLTVTKLDIRPKQLEESSSYRFLLKVSGPEFDTRIGLAFNYDMIKGQLLGNTQ